jgi:zinc D-Ala-D-Ala carboxypeptidase
MRRNALLEELGISPALLETRGLVPCAEAVQLEVAEIGANGKEHLLAPEAASAWRQMKAAASGEGISLLIVSAFRSVDRQVEIVRRKLKAGQRMEDILCVSAPPGFSEHHTGRAIDIGTEGSADLEEAFAETAAFAWLRKHAQCFGFTLSYPRDNPQGYQYEPWHWCYVAGQ